MTDTKTCSNCNQSLPASAFGTRTLKSGTKTLRSKCKDCRSRLRYNTRRRAEDTHKTCTACHQLKEVRYFYNRGSTLRSWCYDCESQKKAEQRKLEAAAREEAAAAAAERVKTTGMKTCRSCQTELPTYRFQSSKTSRDGFAHRCSVCISVKKRKVGIEDEDRVFKWTSRRTLLKEVADSAKRRRFKKPTEFAWEDEE